MRGLLFCSIMCVFCLKECSLFRFVGEIFFGNTKCVDLVIGVDLVICVALLKRIFSFEAYEDYGVKFSCCGNIYNFQSIFGTN